MHAILTNTTSASITQPIQLAIKPAASRMIVTIAFSAFIRLIIATGQPRPIVIQSQAFLTVLAVRVVLAFAHAVNHFVYALLVVLNITSLYALGRVPITEAAAQ